NFDQNFQEEIPLNVRPGQGSRDALSPRRKFPLGLTLFPSQGKEKNFMQNQNWRCFSRVIAVATVALLVVSFTTLAVAQRAGQVTSASAKVGEAAATVAY